MGVRWSGIIGALVLVAGVACEGADTSPTADQPQAGDQEISAGPLVTPPPGCKSHGPKVSITTTDIHFNQECVGAPAATPFTIKFENGECTGCQKAAAKHNVSIYTATLAREQLFRGEIIPQKTTITYHVPPLEQGAYIFQCIVHRLMNGVLVVD